MTNVLVADDDEIQRYLLVNTLLKMQHLVREAEDGEQAFEIFKHAKPKMVIADIEIPHRNGLWFIAEIRKAHPSIPIVAISAKNALLLHKAKLLGADVCMDTPLDMPALHARKLYEAFQVVS